MSIASGRAWQAAGAGLANIGALALQQQERERERKRQEEADLRAAYDREQAAARFADETGIAYRPASAPAVTFTPPTFGESLPQPAARAPDTATSLGVAIRPPGPGYLSRPSAAPAPAAETPFAGIGRIAAARPTPRITGLAETFQPGEFIKTGPSRTERAEIAASQIAGRVGETLATLEPGVAAMSPQERTLVGKGEIPTAVIDRATVREDAATTAAGYRRRYPYDPRTRKGIPPGLSDAETNRLGYYMMQQENDLRPGAGGGGGGGAGRAQARQELGTVEHQIDDTRADLARAERQAAGKTRPLIFPTPPGASRAQRESATAAGEAAFVADSAGAARRVEGLQTRADSLERVRDRMAAVVQGQKPGAGATREQARARALELQRQRMTRAQIMAQMQAEGYDVR